VDNNWRIAYDQSDNIRIDRNFTLRFGSLAVRFNLVFFGIFDSLQEQALVEQEVTGYSIRSMRRDTYRFWWLVHIFCGCVGVRFTNPYITGRINPTPTHFRRRTEDVCGKGIVGVRFIEPAEMGSIN
jgi:hypothetical protein